MVDSQGNLYIASYGGGLLKVPPGGGPVEVVVSPPDVGVNGFSGAPLVRTDDSVLLQGMSAIYRYVPGAVPAVQVWQTTSGGHYYGAGLLEDAQGNVAAFGAATLWDAGGASHPLPWLTSYAVITATASRRFSGASLQSLCFDGTPLSTYSPGYGDHYGSPWSPMARCSAARATPPLPPSGACRPAAAAWPRSPPCRWPSSPWWPTRPAGTSTPPATATATPSRRIDPQTGAKVVWGCDLVGSVRPCGATM